MTAKDKAKDLIDKFMNCDNMIFLTKGAKRCALIAVDEILESHYKLLAGVNTSIYKYWQEVKQEIEKL